ncbi:MAG: hypothetical protein WC121_10930 [Candidatus Kapaibacterium sp.]
MFEEYNFEKEQYLKILHDEFKAILSIHQDPKYNADGTSNRKLLFVTALVNFSNHHEEEYHIIKRLSNNRSILDREITRLFDLSEQRNRKLQSLCLQAEMQLNIGFADYDIIPS